jgi:hypothetical protein
MLTVKSGVLQRKTVVMSIRAVSSEITCLTPDLGIFLPKVGEVDQDAQEWQGMVLFYAGATSGRTSCFNSLTGLQWANIPLCKEDLLLHHYY